MDTTFRKILCPVDFTENSIIALDLACRIAAQNAAPLCLVHVVSIPLSAELSPVPLEPFEVWAQRAREKLETIAREHVPQGVDYEIVTVGGSPAESIVRERMAHSADLIVMATHGRERSVVGRLFLSDVSDRVVREAPCPVLLVPAP